MDEMLAPDKTTRLSALGRFSRNVSTIEQALEDLAALAAQFCDSPYALITLFDGSHHWAKASYGLDLTQAAFLMPLCQYTLNQAEIVSFPDLHQAPSFAESEAVAGALSLSFFTGVPLRLADGKPLGTFVIFGPLPHSLTLAQRDALQRLSHQATDQLELRRQEEHSAEQGSAAPQEIVLREREAKYEALRDASPEAITFSSWENGTYLEVNRRFTILSGYTAEEALGRSSSELNIWVDPRDREELLEQLQKEGVVRDKRIPFRHRNGCPLFCLVTAHLIHVGTQRCLLTMSRDITDLLNHEAEQKRLLAEAKLKADLDPLTGLFNHRAFQAFLQDEWENSQQQHQAFSVAMLDLDNFKFFNDLYGHATGDLVLQRVAQELHRCCRPEDVLARFGGDEFALLLPGLSGDEATGLIKQIQSCLAKLGFQPPDYETEIPLALSFGMASSPEDGSQSALLSVADSRMRHMKSGGQARKKAEDLRVSMSRAVEGFSMLDALVTAVDTKDCYTRHHSEDVLTYSVQIAHELGWDEDDLHTIAVAALLHDVGKIGVPDHILRKPGRLQAEEFAAVRQHPMMGAVMVGAVPGFESVLDAVRHHHERWDGEGYPFGLRGEETPVIARLMAVADAYSAMTTDRPYRKSMGPEKAQEILRSGSGTQWDPECVDALLRVLRQE